VHQNEKAHEKPKIEKSRINNLNKICNYLA